MGEFVNLLNAAGGAFTAWAGRMLIQSSVLIVILAALDLVLRKRVKAVVRYWIWLLVLAKLLLPPSLSSPTSLVSWVGSRLPQTTIIPFTPEAPVASPERVPPIMPVDVDGDAIPRPRIVYEPTPVSEPVPVATVPIQPVVLPTWQALVLVAWLAAVVLMTVLLIQRVSFVHGLLAQSRGTSDSLRALLELCRRQMAVRGGVDIRLTYLSASPSVCGLRRPVILMPEQMVQHLGTPQLRSVLVHELAHIQRGDLWINLLQTLLQIVYLYHPLFWWTNARIRAIREQAVDESVLVALGEEAEEYPRTLLSISKLAFGRPALSLRLLGVVESKKALTGRIRHIVSRPFPRSAKLGLAGLLMVLAIGAALLPMAQASSSAPPDPRQLLARYLEAVTAWDRSVSMGVECDHTMAHQGRDFRHWKYDIQHRRDGDRTEWFGQYQFEGKLDGNPYSFNEEFRDLILDDYYLHFSRRDSGSRPEEAFVGTDVEEWLAILESQSPDGAFLEGRTGGIGAATHQVQAMRDSNDVRYVGQETLDGTVCHIVEAKTKYGTFTVWIAPEKGHNALKSVWRKSGRDILRANIRIEDQNITEWTETLEAVDVQKIGAVFVPVAGRLTSYAKWASGETSEDHTTVRRRDIVLHPDFQTLGAFQVVLPEGTEVRLRGATQPAFRWADGKFTPDLDKYLTRSLVGRPLPGLETIRLDGDPADVTGRTLMICLFDAQQRPSRNIVQQIARQIDSLKKRGIAVLGIQVAKMGETEFRTWAQESQVPFAVGIIGAEEEEARAAWGVHALPWLILTDSRHVVRAEGFDLSELQNRLEAVAAAVPTNSSGKDPGMPATTAPRPKPRAPAGVVVDERGAPVPGARVLLYHRISGWGLGNKIVEEARTDTQGRFALAQPLRFKNSNGTNYTDHFLLFAAHPEHALAWQVIVGGAEKEEYRLTMTTPVTQAFRVTDRDGKPLAQVRVWIHGVGSSDDRNPLLRPYCGIPDDIGLLTTTTDDQGRATLGGLPRTYCLFFASLPGYSNRLISLDTLPQGEARAPMTRAGTAKGQVLTKDGQPVAGAEVWFEADWGEWYFDYAVTDEAGRFANDRLVARGGSWVPDGGTGQYKVSLRHPRFAAPDVTIQLDPGVTEEFKVEAVEGTRLHVQVLEPETERPLAGVRVQGSSASGRLDGYTDVNGVIERCVLNGPASVFVSSPPGGTYVIDVPGKGSGHVQANGGVEKLTLYAPSRLHPLVAIKGRLQLPDGAPAAGIKISTMNHMERYQTATFGGRGNAYTRTNPDGSFELADVPRDGEVFLYGETKDRAYVLAEVLDPAQASPVLTRPLVMREGRTASVLLTDAAGKPRVNMALKLLPRQWGDYVFRADDRSAATDAEGRLTLNGIVPGLEYFIRDAQANMGESGWWNLYNEKRVLLAADDKGSPTQANASRASNPATPATVPPAAQKAGSEIAGVVVDSRGKPIAGASVTVENKDLLLLPQAEKIGAQTGRVLRADSTQTDFEGRFRFTGLIPGKTPITVAAAGYRTEFALSTSTGTEDLRVVLGEPVSYRLSGVAVDESCRAVPGVTVTFVEWTLSGPGQGKDEPPVTVRTDERGQYRFDRLLPPVDRRSVRRLLYARKAGYGAWGYDLDTTGGQATGQIRLPVEEKVSGVVKNESGEPIAGAAVALYSGWNRWGSFSFPPAWQNLAPQTTTGADGSFTLGELPTESDVFLRVRAPGYASGQSPHVRTGRFSGSAVRRNDGTTIVMGGGGADANTPLTITLQRAVTLRGTVVYEGTGQPAPGIRVGTQGQQGSEWSDTATDSQGRFEMTDVAPVPSNLLVVLDNPTRDTMPDWTAAALSFDDLRPGATRNDLRLVLTKGALVRGRATDAQGQPLKGINIAFYSAARPRSGAACQSVDTASDGTWAYHFPPGEVYIYIRTTPPGASWRTTDYTHNVKAGQIIDNVDFTLKQAVAENSPHHGAATGAAQPAGRQSVLPRGATAGPRTQWPASQGGNGHFYQAVRMPKPLVWGEANRLAGQMGGHLVTITSKAESDFVFHLVDDDAYWYHGYNWRGPWIGAVQPPEIKEPAVGWTWVTGEPFTYTNWDTGQPNHFNGAPENRIYLGNQRARIPAWNDVVENFPEVVSFVVEWDDLPTRVVVWSVTAGGNGHWYRVVHVPEGVMWDQANEAAQAQGGYLATITSAAENAFVFALVQDPRYWNGPRGPWIGGYQDPGRPVRESWHWITGEPFTYTKWSPGQPNDGCGADETRLEFGWGATTIADTWNDQPDWYQGVFSYVVEGDPSGPTRVLVTPAPGQPRTNR